MQHWNKRFSIILLIAALWGSGCKDTTNSDNTTDDPPCLPVFETGSLEINEFCLEMQDCTSGFCATFSHAPADLSATCQPAPPPEALHLMATVTDFVTGVPLSDTTVHLVGALDVFQNPVGFSSMMTLTTSTDGKIDVELDKTISDIPLGLLAIVETDGYFTTSTGLVTPEAGCGVYPPAVRNANITAVKQTDLENYSQHLATSFPQMDAHLPLGEKGGVLGIIRQVDDGTPVSDATMKSHLPNSTAHVFYLNDTQDGFNTDATGTSGVFVILNAGLAEDFDAHDTDDNIISRREATTGEAASIIFATTIQVDDRQ